MVSDDRLQRELARLFGEDAAFTSNTYLQAMRALQNLALRASEENARLAQQYPTLAQVYFRESGVFEAVTQALRRATAKIEEMLAGIALTESRIERKGMKLLTKELQQQLPPLGATDGKDETEVICRVKVFDPCSDWTWLITEFDGTDLCFGAVAGHVFELGYFRISELEQVRNRLGLPIERDLYFKPTPLSEIRKEYGQRGQG